MSAPVNGSAAVLDPPAPSHAGGKLETSSSDRGYPAITHFAVASAILLPVACIPYFVYRRRIRSLEQQVRRLNATLLNLQDDMTGYVRQQAASSQRVHAQTASSFQTLSRDLDSLRLQMNEDVSVNMERSHGAARDADQIIAALQVHASLIRSLGVSVADIANFMHDQELRLGLSAPGGSLKLDELRRVAVRMRELKDPAFAKTASKDSLQYSH
ncbi:hypothetical protein BD626DRAFT_481415 [Schizophyllum amplum]|uniref:Peroxin-14 n=1 Tax=Schizophyllum amplum TaxID=97359 RepID=A0A550CU61_9AGAR|nr:hypothetical protein BD626DRAFT_481415 [Auriculariopsis ampla]